VRAGAWGAAALVAAALAVMSSGGGHAVALLTRGQLDKVRAARRWACCLPRRGAQRVRARLRRA